jgi:hypothetical protein
MGRTAAAVTQRDQEQALSRLWLIWPKVKVIRKLLTDQCSPPDPTFGTDRIQAAGSRVEQLKIMGTANMGQIPRFLNR